MLNFNWNTISNIKESFKDKEQIKKRRIYR